MIDEYRNSEAKIRSRRLQQRLVIRPYDEKAVIELIDIAYEAQDRTACISAIDRAAELGLGISGRLYIMKGKCYFRNWRKSGDVRDCKNAIASYKKGLRTVEYQRSAIHYFELALMNLCEGNHQNALDLLGVVMTLYRDLNDTDSSGIYWIEVAQYLVATILIINSRMDEAIDIYEDLVIHEVRVPDLLSYFNLKDNVCWFPMGLTPALLTLEYARLKHRQGFEVLSYELLREFWSRLDRARVVRDNRLATEAARIQEEKRQNARNSASPGKLEIEAAPSVTTSKSPTRPTTATSPPPTSRSLATMHSSKSLSNIKSPGLERTNSIRSNSSNCLENDDENSVRSIHSSASKKSEISSLPPNTSRSTQSVGSICNTSRTRKVSKPSNRIDDMRMFDDGKPKVTKLFNIEEETIEAIEEEKLSATECYEKNGPFEYDETDESCLFLLYNTTSFEEWINDHSIFKAIGDMYRLQFNNSAIASEFYCMASEIIAGNCSVGEQPLGWKNGIPGDSYGTRDVPRNQGSPQYSPNQAISPTSPVARHVNGLVTQTNKIPKFRWEDLPLELKELSVYYLLDRADCLFQLARYGDAESIAHFCYSLLPFDVIVLGRASRCVNPNKPKNMEIIKASEKIFRLVQKVIDTLWFKVKRRRKLNKLLLHKHATTINSFIRMVLTRNRTIGDRLSNISIHNIWPLIKSVAKVVLISGRQQIFDWLEIWNQSAIRILVCFRRWYQTRLKNKFFRGIRVMQRILLGQNIRWQIRKMLEYIEDANDQCAAPRVTVVNGNEDMLSNSKFLAGSSSFADIERNCDNFDYNSSTVSSMDGKLQTMTPLERIADKKKKVVKKPFVVHYCESAKQKAALARKKALESSSAAVSGVSLMNDSTNTLVTTASEKASRIITTLYVHPCVLSFQSGRVTIMDPKVIRDVEDLKANNSTSTASDDITGGSGAWIPYSSTLFDLGGNAYSRFDDPSKHLNYYDTGSALERDDASGIFNMTAAPIGDESTMQACVLEDSLDAFSSSFKSPKELHPQTSKESLLASPHLLTKNNALHSSSAFSLSSGSRLNSPSGRYESTTIADSLDREKGNSRTLPVDNSFLYSKKYDLSNAIDDAYESKVLGTNWYSRSAGCDGGVNIRTVANSNRYSSRYRRDQQQKRSILASSASQGMFNNPSNSIGKTTPVHSSGFSGKPVVPAPAAVAPPSIVVQSLKSISGTVSQASTRNPSSPDVFQSQYGTSVKSEPVPQRYAISHVALNKAKSIGGNIAGGSLAQPASQQWIPFGVLPDKSIVKLLECTVLFITSPSFSFNDAKRVARLVRLNRTLHIKARLAEESAFHQVTRRQRHDRKRHGRHHNSSGNLSSYASGELGGSMSLSHPCQDLHSGPLDSVNVSKALRSSVMASMGSLMSLDENGCAPEEQPPKSRDMPKVLSSSMWSSVRSLAIYGTNIHSMGLLALFDMGIQSLDSLTISGTKGNALTHRFGKYLGERLLTQYDYRNINKLNKEGVGAQILENHLHGGSVVKKVVVGTDFNDDLFVKSERLSDNVSKGVLLDNTYTVSMKKTNSARNGSILGGSVQTPRLGLVTPGMLFNKTEYKVGEKSPSAMSLNPWLDTVRYASNVSVNSGDSYVSTLRQHITTRYNTIVNTNDMKTVMKNNTSQHSGTLENGVLRIDNTSHGAFHSNIEKGTVQSSRDMDSPVSHAKRRHSRRSSRTGRKSSRHYLNSSRGSPNQLSFKDELVDRVDSGNETKETLSMGASPSEPESVAVSAAPTPVPNKLKPKPGDELFVPDDVKYMTSSVSNAVKAEPVAENAKSEGERMVMKYANIQEVSDEESSVLSAQKEFLNELDGVSVQDVNSESSSNSNSQYSDSDSESDFIDEDFGENVMNVHLNKQINQYERYNLHVPEIMNVAVLKRLEICNECKFGDRGTVQLFNLLQYNNTLENITVKQCKLTLRSAISISRYISLTNTLVTLNLNGNKLDFQCISMLIRAIANKGATGCLKDVYVQDQIPAITEREALVLFALGGSLSIRVVASELVDITTETAFERLSGVDIDDDDSVHMRSAFDDLSRTSNMHLASVVNMHAKKVYL